MLRKDVENNVEQKFYKNSTNEGVIGGEEKKERRENEEKKKNTKKDFSEMFEKFWNEYPNKKGKGKAGQLFERLISKAKNQEQLFSEIMNGLSGYKAEILEKNTNKEFICHPTTFLNQSRWQDDYSASTLSFQDTNLTKTSENNPGTEEGEKDKEQKFYEALYKRYPDREIFDNPHYHEISPSEKVKWARDQMEEKNKIFKEHIKKKKKLKA